MPEYDRDFGDENDFNEWVDEEYDNLDDEDEFYIDPDYWEDEIDSDDDYEDGGSFLALKPYPRRPSPGDTIDLEKEYMLGMA